MTILIKEVLKTVDVKEGKGYSTYGGIGRCDVGNDTSLRRLNQYLRQLRFKEFLTQNKPFFHYAGTTGLGIDWLLVEFWIARKLPEWEDLAGPRVLMLSRNLDLLRESMQKFPDKTGYGYTDLDSHALQESEDVLKIHSESILGSIYGFKIYQPERPEGWYREII